MIKLATYQQLCTYCQVWFIIIQQSSLTKCLLSYSQNWDVKQELSPRLDPTFVHFCPSVFSLHAHFLVFMPLPVLKVPLQRLDVFQLRAYQENLLLLLLPFVLRCPLVLSTHLLVLLCFTVFGYSWSSLWVVIYPFSRIPLFLVIGSRLIWTLNMFTPQ